MKNWEPPRNWKHITTIDAHTAGEPLRIVTGGFPRVPGKALDSQIRGLLADIPEVKEVEEIHAHRFGPYLVANITIGIDGRLSVSDGDRIATHVEGILEEGIEFMRRVHVHYHPAGD